MLDSYVFSSFGEVPTYSCGYKFCSFTLAKATWVGCVTHPSRKSGRHESRDALRLARYVGRPMWRGGWSDRHEGAGGVWTRHPDIHALFLEFCGFKFVLVPCCGKHVVWLWLHLRLDMVKKKWKMKAFRKGS